MFRVLLFIILLAAHIVDAQIYSDRDIEIIESKFQYLSDQNLTDASLNDIIVETGKSFLETDYLASSLEKEGPEQLVINLNGFDCSTFLENILALSRSFRMENLSFEDYCSELLKIRYRNGKVEGYLSRLHYFSDWIYDNSLKNVVKDITRETGGELMDLNINFMSVNSSGYKQLRENPDLIPQIREQEKEINQRQYYFIPKEKVGEVENKIRNGDLLAFTSGIYGLDIGHVGIAVQQVDGRIYLLHASSEEGEVRITNEPLAEYILKVKQHSGIIILRPLEPYDL